MSTVRERYDSCLLFGEQELFAPLCTLDTVENSYGPVQPIYSLPTPYAWLNQRTPLLEAGFVTMQCLSCLGVVTLRGQTTSQLHEAPYQ